MTVLHKSAATVCLVALCGLQSAAAETTYKFTVENVNGDAYLAARLARNGQLAVHISDVAQDNVLESSLTTQLQDEDTPITGSCDSMTISTELKNMFHQTFDYTDNNDYSAVVQTALTAGLAPFNKTYPTGDQKWKELWLNEPVSSLAYLLGSTSTQIGCVIGRCTTVDPPVDDGEPVVKVTKKAVLFCKLTPAAQKNTAPFSEEYFKALIARETPLANMTEDDLAEKDLQPSVEAGAAAAAAPTILIAGLVAILTTAFA